MNNRDQEDLIAYQRSEIERLKSVISQQDMRLAKGGIDKQVTFHTADGLIAWHPDAPQFIRLCDAMPELRFPVRKVPRVGDIDRHPGDPEAFGIRRYRLVHSLPNGEMHYQEIV